MLSGYLLTHTCTNSNNNNYYVSRQKQKRTLVQRLVVFPRRIENVDLQIDLFLPTRFVDWLCFKGNVTRSQKLYQNKIIYVLVVLEKGRLLQCSVRKEGVVRFKIKYNTI